MSGFKEKSMTANQFDDAFDQGKYEAEYSQYLADHNDCNAKRLAHMAENFESYEDFRDHMIGVV
jgi:hypothetical protein